MKLRKISLTGISLLVVVTSVGAAPNCIVTKLTGEVEVTVKGLGRRKLAHLVPMERVVPGQKVMYTLSVTNVCERPADDPVVAVAVPEHMTYVAGSAIGPNSIITYSVDGGFSYGAPVTLKVRAAEGAFRAARPVEYTNIRWSMNKPLAEGAVAFARFIAVFQ